MGGIQFWPHSYPKGQVKYNNERNKYKNERVKYNNERVKYNNGFKYLTL